MELIAQAVAEHLERTVPERPERLRQMEALAGERKFPIVGPAAGHFCHLVARIAGAREVFEMGSGFGYSTAWFAMAVRANGGGTVHHVVWDEALSAEAREHLTALGLGDLVRYQVAEAVEALRDAEGPFDLIFLDIDKPGYPAALEVIEERLRPGGVLIADNALWHGRIFDREDVSEATAAIRTFTARVTGDGWTSSIVPIRDGLLVARRG